MLAGRGMACASQRSPSPAGTASMAVVERDVRGGPGQRRHGDRRTPCRVGNGTWPDNRHHRSRLHAISGPRSRESGQTDGLTEKVRCALRPRMARGWHSPGRGRPHREPLFARRSQSRGLRGTRGRIRPIRRCRLRRKRAVSVHGRPVGHARSGGGFAVMAHDRADGTIQELLETGTVGIRRNTALQPGSFDGWIDTAFATGEIAFHVEEAIEQIKRRVLSEYKTRSTEQACNIAPA